MRTLHFFFRVDKFEARRDVCEEFLSAYARKRSRSREGTKNREKKTHKKKRRYNHARMRVRLRRGAERVDVLVCVLEYVCREYIYYIHTYAVFVELFHLCSPIFSSVIIGNVSPFLFFVAALQ